MQQPGEVTLAKGSLCRSKDLTPRWSSSLLWFSDAIEWICWQSMACRPNLAQGTFLCTFNWLRKKSKEYFVTWKLYEIVLLGRSHAHSFSYYPRFLSDYKGRAMLLWQGSQDPQNLQYFRHGLLGKNICWLLDWKACHGFNEVLVVY